MEQSHIFLKLIILSLFVAPVNATSEEILHGVGAESILELANSLDGQILSHDESNKNNNSDSAWKNIKIEVLAPLPLGMNHVIEIKAVDCSNDMCKTLLLKTKWALGEFGSLERLNHNAPIDVATRVRKGGDGDEVVITRSVYVEGGRTIESLKKELFEFRTSAEFIPQMRYEY
ncbi:MAG: hypothetical protein GJ680_10300 [Alteromonadaceae bacterium]|nr:hypothetical protein [Alteromonadaceae bacterium]